MRRCCAALEAEGLHLSITRIQYCRLLSPDSKVQTETKTLTLMHLQPPNHDDRNGGATGVSFSQTTWDAEQDVLNM